MEGWSQKRAGKRFLVNDSDNFKKKIDSATVNNSMKELEEISAQIRSLELFKESMVHAMRNGMGQRYQQAIGQRDLEASKMNRLLLLSHQKETDADQLFLQIHEDENRLMNINAIRRGIVFDRHHKNSVKLMADYNKLTKDMQALQHKIKAMKKEHDKIMAEVTGMEDAIMQHKMNSKNAFNVLGDAPAKIQKKIASVERKITSLGHRQKHLMRTIAHNMSSVQLKASGAYISDSDE